MTYENILDLLPPLIDANGSCVSRGWLAFELILISKWLLDSELHVILREAISFLRASCILLDRAEHQVLVVLHLSIV